MSLGTSSLFGHINLPTKNEQNPQCGLRDMAITICVQISQSQSLLQSTMHFLGCQRNFVASLLSVTRSMTSRARVTSFRVSDVMRDVTDVRQIGAGELSMTNF